MTTTKVPSVGQPEWQGEITEGTLTQIIGGGMKVDQAMAKAIARKLRDYMRKEAGNE